MFQRKVLQVLLPTSFLKTITILGAVRLSSLGNRCSHPYWKLSPSIIRRSSMQGKCIFATGICKKTCKRHLEAGVSTPARARLRTKTPEKQNPLGWRISRWLRQEACTPRSAHVLGGAVRNETKHARVLPRVRQNR